MTKTKLVNNKNKTTIKKADKMETDDVIKCPRCDSEDINILGMNYPKAYECEKCKYTFIKGRQALIDE